MMPLRERAYSAHTACFRTVIETLHMRSGTEHKTLRARRDCDWIGDREYKLIIGVIIDIAHACRTERPKEF